jgi:hypothetical protein
MFFKGSFRISLVACTLAAALGASSSVEAATPIGPKAVVKGTSGGPVAVTVRLLDNDGLRVCFQEAWDFVPASLDENRGVAR